MPVSNDAATLFKGFSKLNLEERFKRLIEMGALDHSDVSQLKKTAGLPYSMAENFIENVIGYYQLPLGVAANFCIDGKNYAIPMAVEETSIIAAVSKTARWINQSGSITTETIGKEIIGQLQIGRVKNYDSLNNILSINKTFLIELANENIAHGLVKRGGGVQDIYLRKIDRGDGSDMAVIHVLMDPCDAMGANIMNQVCEYLREPIQNLSNEIVTMCILSNLNDHKLTRATVVLNDIDPELGARIEEASIFAENDPYRATTHNKGILNGIDPILIATGNDWRAVDAGIHAYAARDQKYRAISRWRMEGTRLVGVLEAPITVGIVGGLTKLHPTANMCLRMLDVKHADELSRIIAAVGLVQNLGAINALCTVGIIQGHMKLHIKNLTLSAGANEKEIPLVHKKLEEILTLRKAITLSNAIEVLRDLRNKQLTPSLENSNQTV